MINTFNSFSHKFLQTSSNSGGLFSSLARRNLFIRSLTTPNPHSLMFNPGKAVTGDP